MDTKKEGKQGEPKDEKEFQKNKSEKLKGEDIPVPEGLFSEEELEDLPDYENEEGKEVEHESPIKKEEAEKEIEHGPAHIESKTAESDQKKTEVQSPEKKEEIKETFMERMEKDRAKRNAQIQEFLKQEPGERKKGVTTALFETYRNKAQEYIATFNDLFYEDIKAAHEEQVTALAKKLELSKQGLYALMEVKEPPYESKDGKPVKSAPPSLSEEELHKKNDEIQKKLNEFTIKGEEVSDIKLDLQKIKDEFKQFNEALTDFKRYGNGESRRKLITVIKNSTTLKITNYNSPPLTQVKSEIPKAGEIDKTQPPQIEPTNLDKIHILSENLSLMEEAFELNPQNAFNKIAARESQTPEEKAVYKLPITEEKLSEILLKISGATKDIETSLKSNSAEAKSEKTIRRVSMAVAVIGAAATAFALFLLAVPGVNVAAGAVLAKMGLAAGALNTSSLLGILVAAIPTTIAGAAPNFFKGANKFQNLFNLGDNLCKEGVSLIKIAGNKADIKLSTPSPELKQTIDDIQKGPEEKPAASNAEGKSEKGGSEPKEEGPEGPEGEGPKGGPGGMF